MRGIFVLGVGRSGTSLVTRVVNLLGIPTCVPPDLLAAGRSNPKGFWESRTTVVGDELLLALGDGRWWCPAQPQEILQRTTPVVASSFSRAFRAMHPTDEWVVKDPRLSFTLPFWLQALDVRPVVVLVTRAPSETVASVGRQMGLPTGLALALWERTTRTVLQQTQGLPAIVAPLREVVDRLHGWCDGCAEFLARCSFTSAAFADPAALDSVVDRTLLHQGPAVRLSREQEQLLDAVNALTGMHASLPAVALPDETQATIGVFEDGRRRIRAEGFPPVTAARQYGSSGDDWNPMYDAMYAAVAEAHAAAGWGAPHSQRRPRAV
jgi:hypothetical protein